MDSILLTEMWPFYGTGWYPDLDYILFYEFSTFRTLLHLALFIVCHNILWDGMLELEKELSWIRC